MVFAKTLMGMTCFYTRKDSVKLMSSLWHRAQHRYGIEPKGILKNSADFYENHHGYPMKNC